MARVTSFLGAVAVLAITVGCGGSGGSSTPPPQSISVAISPASSSSLVATELKFTATVSGTTNTIVSFSVVEGAAGGRITSGGDYLAPRVPGLFHVRATSNADTSKFAEATVTIRDYDNSVQRVADLEESRDFGSATLLQDGSVLLVGGRGLDGKVQQQAQRYLYPDNRYVNVGTSVTGRLAHTATILPSGKVLIAGGWDGVSTDPFGPVLQTSEIFDPVNSTFTAGPQMSVPRWHHVSTLLKDGRVLLTGGVQLLGNGFSASPNNEIYDPATNKFTAIGRMVESGRFRHTATLLADGRVLLVGGRNNNCTANCPIYALSSAEIIDPVTGVSTPTGSLNVSRYWHTATLLEDGRVLILGGETLEDTGTGSDQVQDAEIYDPVTGQFTLYGKTIIPRGQHEATMLNNGQIVLTGGAIRNGTITTFTELFNPSTAMSTAGPDLHEQHVRHSAIRLKSGEVLIIGGSNLYQPLVVTEIFR